MRGSIMLRKTVRKIKQRDPIYSDFKLIMVLGQGSFGKVILAELKFDKQLYAIKVLRKDNLIQTRQIQNLISEKNIMLEVDHPFLVSLDYVFSDELRIHLVMPFINGGELY